MAASNLLLHMAGVAAAALGKGGQDIGAFKKQNNTPTIKPFKMVLYSICRVLHRHKESQRGYIFITSIAVV